MGRKIIMGKNLMSPKASKKLKQIETIQKLIEKIKSELNIGEKRGLRYSWGYPSCPDILQHRLVWKLLEPEKSDMTLTESGQIIPEQSTAALIVHHPEAEYFVL